MQRFSRTFYRLICSRQGVIPSPQASSPGMAFAVPQTTEGEGDEQETYADVLRLVLTKLETFLV